MITRVIEDLATRDLDPFTQDIVIKMLDRFERQGRFEEVEKIRYHLVRERILQAISTSTPTT